MDKASVPEKRIGFPSRLTVCGEVELYLFSILFVFLGVFLLLAVEKWKRWNTWLLFFLRHLLLFTFGSLTHKTRMKYGPPIRGLQRSS